MQWKGYVVDCLVTCVVFSLVLAVGIVVGKAIAFGMGTLEKRK